MRDRVKAETFVALVGLLALVLGTGCADVTVVVGRLDAQAPRAETDMPLSDAAASDAAGSPTDAGDSSSPAAREPVSTRARPVVVESGSLEAFCSGRGPALRRLEPAPCTERLERELFSHALCACVDMSLGGDAVAIDAFDSSLGAYMNGQSGAAIAAGGTLAAVAPEIQVRGSVLAAGSAPLVVAGIRFEVEGDLAVNGAVDARGSGVRIGRDAWFGNDVLGTGEPIAVGRDAFQRVGRRGLERVVATGQKTIADFAIDPPCPCAEDQRLDLAAIVAEGRALSDNSALGLDDAALSGTLATRSEVLPCGRIALTNPAVSISTLAFRVSGRTALFIEGDLTITSGTLFLNDFAPGAELDIYISGKLVIVGTFLLGDPARPSATRLFVGAEIEGATGLVLAARVYAPRATLDLAGVADAYGSVLAARITTTGTQRFHHDRDGLECSGSMCPSCASDTDCCAPQVCNAGACRSL